MKTLTENFERLTKANVKLSLFYSVTVSRYGASLQGTLTMESMKYLSNYQGNTYIDDNGYCCCDTELNSGLVLKFVLTPEV